MGGHKRISWTFLGLAALAPTPAAAESIAASDCNLDFKTVFNKGDAVCVIGEFDQVPPSKIFAEAYVYVVPVGAANPFADVTGAPNYIIGSGGAGSFFDEYVWLPPLKTGQYEFVIDNYPFFKDQSAAYDPGDDSRSGFAFSVSNAPTVFTVDSGAIKAAAAEGLLAAAQLALLAQTLSAIDTVSTVVDWWITFGGVGGLAGGALGLYCTYAMKDCPTSYNSAVITIGTKIISGMADSLTKKYDAIIADPPDPNFKAVVPLDFSELIAAGYPWTPAAERELPRAQVALSAALALQNAAYRALVPSMEKVQGAKQASDNLWQLLHAEKVEAYATLALVAGDRLLLEADALETYLQQNGGLEVGLSAAEFNAEVSAVQQDGFTPEQRDYLRSFGLGELDIDATAAAVAAQPTLTDDLHYGSVLARARASYLAVKPALQDLAAQAAAVRGENADAALRPGPALTLAPAPAAKVGVPVQLSASAAHFDPAAALTYTWDLDLDGAYDDAVGPQVPFTARAPGLQIAAAKVSDGAQIDVGFVLVDVSVSNSPPEISAAVPLDPAPFAAVGDAVALHVDVVDADTDPLTISWTVDGQPLADGPDAVFMMPDEQAHWISVVVADDDPYSPDARMTRVVRAAKWQSESPGTDTDASTTSDTDTTTDDPSSPTTSSDPSSPTTSSDPSSPTDTPTSDPSLTETAGADTTPTDPGDATTSQASSTTSQDTIPADGDTGGCACRSDAAPPTPWLLVALLALRRRRARD